mmetsp:Transcript_13865/g.41772  ORF Transcript_13865/g.41772 Transcript_13865/m.41772 type:complete len:354 (-) Transcript_13865:1834-2895(-)
MCTLHGDAMQRRAAAAAQIHLGAQLPVEVADQLVQRGEVFEQIARLLRRELMHHRAQVREHHRQQGAQQSALGEHAIAECGTHRGHGTGLELALGQTSRVGLRLAPRLLQRMQVELLQVVGHAIGEEDRELDKVLSGGVARVHLLRFVLVLRIVGHHQRVRRVVVQLGELTAVGAGAVGGTAGRREGELDAAVGAQHGLSLASAVRLAAGDLGVETVARLRVQSHRLVEEDRIGRAVTAVVPVVHAGQRVLGGGLARGGLQQLERDRVGPTAAPARHAAQPDLLRDREAHRVLRTAVAPVRSAAAEALRGQVTLLKHAAALALLAAQRVDEATLHGDDHIHGRARVRPIGLQC